MPSANTETESADVDAMIEIQKNLRAMHNKRKPLPNYLCICLMALVAMLNRRLENDIHELLQCVDTTESMDV